MIIKVGRIERGVEEVGLEDTEIVLDMVVEVWCGGWSEWNEGRFGDLIDNRRDRGILGWEVMWGLRNRMGVM